MKTTCQIFTNTYQSILNRWEKMFFKFLIIFPQLAILHSSIFNNFKKTLRYSYSDHCSGSRMPIDHTCQDTLLSPISRAHAVLLQNRFILSKDLKGFSHDTAVSLALMVYKKQTATSTCKTPLKLNNRKFSIQYITERT